jgi:hypothetical protein
MNGEPLNAEDPWFDPVSGDPLNAAARKLRNGGEDEPEYDAMTGAPLNNAARRARNLPEVPDGCVDYRTSNVLKYQLGTAFRDQGPIVEIIADNGQGHGPGILRVNPGGSSAPGASQPASPPPRTPQAQAPSPAEAVGGGGGAPPDGGARAANASARSANGSAPFDPFVSRLKPANPSITFDRKVRDSSH